MLTLLRKIRRSLIKSGSTKSYLFYAIGEIALVVIGILIALQINNWNEERKERTLELKLLVELKTGLQSDQDGIIESRIDRSLRYINHVDDLILILDNTLPFHDSIGYKFNVLTGATGISLSNGAYSSIESIGIQIIKNDTLRQKVVSLFTQSIPYLTYTYENNRNNVMNFGRPILRSEFKNTDDNYIPLNFKKLRQNVQLYNVLKNIKVNNNSILNALNRVNREIDSIVLLIDQELNH